MSSPIILRPASLADIPTLALIASETYKNTTLENFLRPRRYLYPADYKASFQQRTTLRLFDPRNITYVACEATSQNIPIGYTQSVRLGNDAGALAQIAGKRTLLLIILAWVFKIWFKVRNFILTDQSLDKNALHLFMSCWENEDKKHWAVKEFPERENRWHVQSLVVNEKWRRQGVGTKLMNEVMSRARAEGVVVGVEATAQGETLYKNLGFQMLGSFMNQIDGEDLVSVMMWSSGTAEKI